MLDSINVGMSGLTGYAKGLRVIANNTANLDTPGYKSSSLQFADLFYDQSTGADGNPQRLGHGLETGGTRLDFTPGELRQTGNDFDLALDGEGFFTLRTTDGATRYTRAGQFAFDQDGTFIDSVDGSKVMGVGPNGQPVEIRLAGLHTSAGQATGVVRFTGNISSTETDVSVASVKVFDALGEEHTLALHLTAVDGSPGTWNVDVLDGSTSAGNGQLVFTDGQPSNGSQLTFSYQPAGRAAHQITLDFSTDVTSFAAGDLSTLAMSSQDGRAPGNLTKTSFDETGTLVATYSNGDTVKGPRLQLARFRSPEDAQQEGDNQFAAADGSEWEVGTAGEGGFGAVRAGTLEMSNVDLSREFTDLVVMQRGYQASSQVISTANDMLQELFRLKANGG